LKDLLSLSEFLINYANAIDIGFKKFIQASPVFIRQYMERQARKKLNSTRDAYIEAIKTQLTNNVLVVELDKSSWIANAVEKGVSEFDMKVKHLQSPKAKISKKGYRFMVIPIGKDPSSEGGKTEKSKEFQKKIKQALEAKKFGITKLKAQVGGGIFETQKVLSDNGLDGFYRYRKHESFEAYHAKKNKGQWQYVLFRVMSENPKSQSTWHHPGIEPVNIFKDTEKFINENASKMLEGFIDAEIEKIIGSYAKGE
jgi:hypothetical protein